VLRRVEVLRRVLVLRAVTTSDVPTGATEPQVHPSVTELQTLFTAVRARPVGTDELQMATPHCHE